MNLHLLVLFSLILCTVVCLPIKNSRADTPITRLVIPYAPYTSELVKNLKGKRQKVYVPLKMDIVPRVSNPEEGRIVVGSRKGVALNLAEGAYPVYYMAGNVNGQFQDKAIYLLEQKQMNENK